MRKTMTAWLLLLFFLAPQGLFLAEGEAPNNTDSNTPSDGDIVNTCPFVVVQHGRDGRDGLPGVPGRDGEKGERGEQGPSTGVGATYIRWGRDDCPGTPGTQLVYAGRAAGEWAYHRGGGSEHLCLPNNPDYLNYRSGTQTGTQIGRGYLYGTEYQLSHQYDQGPLSRVAEHNAPCAVCYTSTRGTVLMIPAKTRCPLGWTREYYGYLMTEKYTHNRSSFACVDNDAESVPGGAADTDGALFYHVEARCNGIPCPPYDDQKEVTCVVCSK